MADGEDEGTCAGGEIGAGVFPAGYLCAPGGVGPGDGGGGVGAGEGKGWAFCGVGVSREHRGGLKAMFGKGGGAEGVVEGKGGMG